MIQDYYEDDLIGGEGEERKEGMQFDDIGRDGNDEEIDPIDDDIDFNYSQTHLDDFLKS